MSLVHNGISREQSIFAIEILSVPARVLGYETSASALREPLLCAFLWRALRDCCAEFSCSRSELDALMADLQSTDHDLPVQHKIQARKIGSISLDDLASLQCDHLRAELRLFLTKPSAH
ncbi:hypothetical protein [Thalassospira alkalitolerans]|uniref:hypothetical protein n=1 Tax=Thalassospira alkalitolerans TaxID=1293890 RepID=UPI00111C4C70|nr:hypothetical protein [Thalassospira alkalitolerans]